MSERGEAKRDGAKQQKIVDVVIIRRVTHSGNLSWWIIKNMKNQSLLHRVFGLKFAQILLKLVGISIQFSNSSLAKIIAKQGLR